MDSLVNLPNNNSPSLYLNIGGENLPRHCTIPITQLLVTPQNHVYLIDVRCSVSAMWHFKMQLATLDRTKLSQSSSFNCEGSHMIPNHRNCIRSHEYGPEEHSQKQSPLLVGINFPFRASFLKPCVINSSIYYKAYLEK